MPSEEPAQRPIRVPDIAAAVAEQPARSTVSLAELGRQRFVILEGLGLADPCRLEARIPELTVRAIAMAHATQVPA